MGRRRMKGLVLVVGMGIALFVAGFLITVSSLSGPSAASSEDAAVFVAEPAVGFGSVNLAVGLLMSLGGVVLATAGPLMFFVFSSGGASRDTSRGVE